jgi:type III secretion system YscQ/HrcQ family protein
MQHDASANRVSRTRFYAALPRLSSGALEARNRAYQSPAAVLAGERIFIWQESGATATVGELTCQLGEWPLALAADNLAAVEPRLEGFESFAPTETCAALVEHAMSPVIQLLERISGLPLECADFKRGAALPEAPGGEVRVGFVVMDSQLRLVQRGWVRTALECWQHMDFGRALAIPNQRMQSVPVRLSIQLGQTRVAARMLRGLAVGDALRPGRRLPRTESESGDWLVSLVDSAGQFRLQAALLGDELTLQRHTVNALDTPTETSAMLAEDSQQAAQADALHDIECDVSFEVGSLRMTVADIGKLRAGQSIRLGVRLQEQPVRMLVNGRVLARGELACVGDEMVVVVTDTRRLPTL